LELILMDAINIAFSGFKFQRHDSQSINTNAMN